MFHLKHYLLAVDTWVTILALILGPGGIVFALVTWLREKNKDKSETNLTDANTISVLSRGEAESEKIKAEAVKIRADADATIADSALRLAQRLSEECDMAKKDLKEKEERLDKTQQDLNSVKESLNNALAKVAKLEEELGIEKKKNQDMTEKNAHMALEIIKLTEELEKIKNESRL